MATRASEEWPRSQIIEGPEVERSDQDIERQPFMNGPTPLPQPRWAKKSRTSMFNEVMAVVNLALGIILATSIGLIAHESSRSSQRPVARVAEPYSPASEAVIPVIMNFRPNPIFQSETSDEVEAAWKEAEGPSNGIVALSHEESVKFSKNNQESSTSPSESEKYLYAISMYQQLGCLNTIRKSFYREKFYPALTDELFQSQKNDCFDFLRQTIQCHGDISMAYFPAESQDVSLSDSAKVNLHRIGSPKFEARSKGLPSFWDVEHSCRALGPIEDWVEAHQGLEEHGLVF